MEGSLNLIKKDPQKGKFLPEHEIKSTILNNKSFRAALLSIFTALSVVLGYLLVFLPNIELITLMIFLSGFIMGKKEGIIVGGFSSLIFCFFNPLGTNLLLLIVVQLPYYSMVGFIGALTRIYFKKKTYYKPKEDLYVTPVLIIFGLLAVIMTSIFQFFADLVGYLSFYSPGYPLILHYLIGLPFSIVHVVGNLLGFVFILPGLIQLLYKLLD